MRAYDLLILRIARDQVYNAGGYCSQSCLRAHFALQSLVQTKLRGVIHHIFRGRYVHRAAGGSGLGNKGISISCLEGSLVSVLEFIFNAAIILDSAPPELSAELHDI